MRSPRNIRPIARILTVVGVAYVLAVPSLHAQAMAGRWRVELHTGVGVRMHSGTSTSASGVETKTGAAGFLGALGFSRWFSDDLAGSVSLGALAVSAETRAGVGGVETKTAVVIPFFIGVRRYVATPDPESGTRFFGSVEVGPVTGYQSATRVGSVVGTESITRTALGGRAGVGVDFRLGSQVMLGIVGGYALMTDFSEAVGGHKNHSGADLGLSLGILFGG